MPQMFPMPTLALTTIVGGLLLLWTIRLFWQKMSGSRRASSPCLDGQGSFNFIQDW